MSSDFLIRDGLKYAYDRAAVKEFDGSVKLSQLRYDEVVVCPGFIYRRVKR